MGRKRDFYFTMIFTVIILMNLLPILATDQDSGYVLISYYVGDDPSPGENVIINAEVYKQEKRLADRENTIIYLFPLIDDIIDRLGVSMAYQVNGIFEYNLTIPSTFNHSITQILGRAFYKDQEIATVDVIIRINLGEAAEKDIKPPIHSISHKIVSPNETITITSFVPYVAEQIINPIDVNITIQTTIRHGYVELPGTFNQFSPQYIEAGYFEAEYIVPIITSNVSLRTTNELNVHIEVFTVYLDEEFQTFFMVNINDFFLIPSMLIDESTVYLKILALDNHYIPLENVTCELVDLQTNPQQMISIPTDLPPTNDEGITKLNLSISLPFEYLMVGIIGFKGKDLSFKDYHITGLEFWPYFRIIPSTSNYEYSIHYDKEGIRRSFVAMDGNKLLKHTDLYLYLYWAKGIVKIAKETTDENGMFHIKVPWPQNFERSSRGYILALYYNGSSWKREYFTFSQLYYKYTINQDESPSIELKEFEEYKIINITWQYPSYALFPRLSCIVQYKYHHSVMNSVSGQHPFFASYSTTKYETSQINCIGFIDRDIPLDYLIVIGWAQNSSSEMNFYYWFYNPDGSLRSKPEDFPNEPFFTLDIDFLVRISLFIIIIGLILLIIIKSKKKVY